VEVKRCDNYYVMHIYWYHVLLQSNNSDKVDILQCLTLWFW